ncbi:hypothetical protein PAF17_15840 [Paracoccus sp. Z330]|uniref:Uncharacterized protein n=1 Tax=Paracoccus onchidii TaxID=3017813 RepID=A0ABT4ZHY2_9RHOB|nr:hypothetical protein [Paracoccus onchidii]MDB6178963.1 hypothetical protein [Paracoccus onchidii]
MMTPGFHPSPAHIKRLERCEAIVAECVAENPELIPVFERIEEELTKARASAVKDPLSKARMLAEQRRQARAQ